MNTIIIPTTKLMFFAKNGNVKKEAPGKLKVTVNYRKTGFDQ